jgi:hypothetical protein
MIAALYVAKGGAYFGLKGVDPWDEERDARKYDGEFPVVAHPPCERWGRYWSGGPSAKVRRTKGDDGGCFEAALRAVRECGGVLEHPEASHAWAHFGLVRPRFVGLSIVGGKPYYGWSMADAWGGWTCQVEQGHYGHRARKKTWLYACVRDDCRLPELIWGPSTGQRLDEGFHSKAERDAARAAGRAPIPRLSTRENIATPIPFRDLLLSIARSAHQDGTKSLW